jgi:endonuclease/exonuclease/phosphatase family metal-dependent hydrolase
MRIHPIFDSVNCHIATFNCKNMSIHDPQKLKFIAETITTSNADIVALQEINKREAIGELLKLLGNDYKAIHHMLPIDNSRIHEYMAFIYRSGAITAINCFTFTRAEKALYVGSSNKIMIRSPVYARFIIGDKTDVVIISYHANQKNPMYDCMHIKDNIAAIQVNNTCNTIVVLGDFNTTCDDKFAFQKIRKRDWLPTLPNDKFTNFRDTEQNDNIWYNAQSCRITEPARVLRECVPPGATPASYSDHCMVVCKLVITRGMSCNARTFNEPDMTSVLACKKYKKIRKFISIPCFGKTTMACTVIVERIS